MASLSLFYDAKDYELLAVVNRFCNRDEHIPQEHPNKLIYAALHPHGIIELAESKEIRVAYAVVHLLDTLEVGQVDDRLGALQALHDEVLFSASSNFRYNTGRVLIQIMKSLVRAKNNHEEQLRLAHDFREAATGKRRVIRKMLKRYHLLEMPEEWNQVAFDNHVHDANTKGRKSATHLIMDAWIKGIRKLNVVYYNFVEPAAVRELLQAAKIMEIKVDIGIEFQARFHNRYVQFIWEPQGFHSYAEMLSFMNEKPVQHLMRMGREASMYHHHYVMSLLHKFNTSLRYEISNEFGIPLDPINENDILALVGVGQTSRTHLAELIYRQIKSNFLREYTQSPMQTAEQQALFQQLLQKITNLSPETIVDTWLGQDKNPDISLPLLTSDEQNVPEIMRLLPTTLIDWLTSIHPDCHITLNLSNLQAEDVLELLYECYGMITHLELFNLKNFTSGKLGAIRTISAMQTAINEGNAIILKRIIRNIIKHFPEPENAEQQARLDLFNDILRNIPRLPNYYSTTPLKTRIGSDSTSRSTRLSGMGFVFIDTLPPKARKELFKPESQHQTIPLTIDVFATDIYYPKIHQFISPSVTRFIRSLPWMQHFNKRKVETWTVDNITSLYNSRGNIATLGGFQQENFVQKEPTKNSSPPSAYLNTTLSNILKVVFGFSLTVLTFAFTQSWWVLAWFGPIIWFGITGFRNILQATLSAGGVRRSPLLRWNDYLSWSRLSDSLMYTGLSVPLLEFGVRWLLLEKTFGLSSLDSPTLFFTVISIVNGAYIAGHNLYRGFPKEAIVGNLFRSFLAIPLSLAYSVAAHQSLIFFALATPENLLILQQGAAVLSKLASDSVAAIIEGYADKVEYLRLRHWDYKSKLNQLFAYYEKLEILLPDQDVQETLENPKSPVSLDDQELITIEKVLIINALDLMYFWMYQPRARQTFIKFVNSLNTDEKTILAQAQKTLNRIHDVSLLFVDGLVGKEFARPLAFYLDKHEQYLRDMEKVLHMPLLSKN